MPGPGKAPGRTIRAINQWICCPAANPAIVPGGGKPGTAARADTKALLCSLSSLVRVVLPDRAKGGYLLQLYRLNEVIKR